MNTIVAIKGTNGSGKSSVVRELITRLGKAATLRFNNKEAGYRCKYGDQSIFVLGKYTSECGGLDSSFSYKDSADDLLLCLDALAAKGHVICEGITSYGFERVTRFAHEQHRKGNHMIFAHMDTPAEQCIERVLHRRTQAGNHKPFNPDNLLRKYESVLKSQERLRGTGHDVRSLPTQEAVETLLHWFQESGTHMMSHRKMNGRQEAAVLTQ